MDMDRDRDRERDRDRDKDTDMDTGRDMDGQSLGIGLSAVAHTGGWSFCCPPCHRGIGLSAVALLRGSDFPLWPLPADRIFCYCPSCGIRLSAVALKGPQLPHREIV